MVTDLPTAASWVDSHRPDPHRGWVHDAIRAVEAEQARTADTPIYRMTLTPDVGIDVHLKDESAHPTGSLKHRLASSLILYGLVNGWIGQRTTLVEASSGSTAVSEAYFARLLGLPFIAVLPRGTSAEKIDLIAAEGGRCHFVDRADEVYAEAQRIARACGGHYLDQFTYAERATDWRGNNNIAESICAQLEGARHPVPAWVVVGAGTGGTSATLGRFLRLRRLDTKVAVVDPEGSAFFDSWHDHDLDAHASGSRIEGIGRPRPEPSFLPTVIDRMIRVADHASVRAMRVLRERAGLDVGPSTGTSVVGALLIAQEMRRHGQAGSIVTLICDRGDRYRQSFDHDDWLAAKGIDVGRDDAALDDLLESIAPVAR
jgi:cysteine synthase A